MICGNVGLHTITPELDADEEDQRHMTNRHYLSLNENTPLWLQHMWFDNPNSLDHSDFEFSSRIVPFGIAAGVAATGAVVGDLLALIICGALDASFWADGANDHSWDHRTTIVLWAIPAILFLAWFTVYVVLAGVYRAKKHPTRAHLDFESLYQTLDRRDRATMKHFFNEAYSKKQIKGRDKEILAKYVEQAGQREAMMTPDPEAYQESGLDAVQHLMKSNVEYAQRQGRELTE